MKIFQKLSKHSHGFQDSDIVSPVTGTKILTSSIADQVFAQEVMGQTIGIIPSDGHIVCPVNGEVEVMFPTGHAFGIKGFDGNSYLIHIGIETVQLQGKGFTSYLKQGQIVKAGQKAVDVDLTYVKENHLDTTVMLIVTQKQHENTVISFKEDSRYVKGEIINKG